MIALSGLASDFQHAASRFVLGDNFAEVVAAARLFHVVAQAHSQGKHFAGAMQSGDHVGEVKWLDQVVERPCLHRLHGTIYHVVGAHHDDDGRGIGLLHTAQHFHSIDPGQNDVEQDKVGSFFSEKLERVFARRRREDFKPLCAQSARNRAERQFFVIDNKYGIGHRKSGVGR